MTHECSTTGCPKKLTYRMLLEPLCTQTVQSQVAGTTTGGPPGDWKNVFWSFLTKTISRIKRSQVIFMGKFGPTALNFG